VQENLGKALVAAGPGRRGRAHPHHARRSDDPRPPEQERGPAAAGAGHPGRVTRRPALAEQRLGAAYQLDPTHAATLAALARIAARRNDPRRPAASTGRCLLQTSTRSRSAYQGRGLISRSGKLHQQAGELPEGPQHVRARARARAAEHRLQAGSGRAAEVGGESPVGRDHSPRPSPGRREERRCEAPRATLRPARFRPSFDATRSVPAAKISAISSA
jgi:hypothetical protein